RDGEAVEHDLVAPRHARVGQSSVQLRDRDGLLVLDPAQVLLRGGGPDVPPPRRPGGVKAAAVGLREGWQLQRDDDAYAAAAVTFRDRHCAVAHEGHAALAEIAMDRPEGT